jgi:hypothetical protein
VISEQILHEILYYEKNNGKKPSFLILVDKELRDQFFSEQYNFVKDHPRDDVNFKRPGEFVGVKFLWKNIHSYGGSAKWMLVGDE